MKSVFYLLLRIIRFLYGKLFKPKNQRLNVERNFDVVSDMIYELLTSDAPCMVARYGSTELSCIINYLGVSNSRHSIVNYIKGTSPQWWWNPKVLQQMEQWSGFFPATEDNAERFSKMMLEDSAQLDILAAWSSGIHHLDAYIRDLPKTTLTSIEPYWSSRPWTRALAGKKVLVIHPFANQIAYQYNNHRSVLFQNPNVLPEFSIQVIPAVQSLGGESNGFQSWFDALDWMKAEMDKNDYDIALIGCGAYGFPLAAHAKRTGHKAIHLAGALQLLFGIKGKRWENPKYGAGSLGYEGAYPALFNEYWVYPGEEGRPKNASAVEGACYW